MQAPGKTFLYFFKGQIWYKGHLHTSEKYVILYLAVSVTQSGSIFVNLNVVTVINGQTLEKPESIIRIANK